MIAGLTDLAGQRQPLQAVAHGAGGAPEALGDRGRPERLLGRVLTHVVEDEAVKLSGPEPIAAGRLTVPAGSAAGEAPAVG